jgi:SAM-dependent methyltransferase
LSVETKPNYDAWQQASWDWYMEVLLRRRTDSVYDEQEKYLVDFFRGRAEVCRREEGRPLRVLEVGCGFGRHLAKIHQLDDVEAYGCDQSSGLLEVAKTRFARFPDLLERMTLVEPDARLPYEDNSFDVVYTVSVLIHIAPEDVQDRMNELHRVSNDLVLNLELPSFPYSYKWDTAHEGCWLHDFIGLHHGAGPCRVEVDLDVLAPRVAVYRAFVGDDEHGTTVTAEGRQRGPGQDRDHSVLEAAMRFAKFCQVYAQDKFSEQAIRTREQSLKTQEQRRRAEQERLRGLELQRRIELCRQRCDELNETIAILRHRLEELKQRKAVRLAHWLGSHQWLRFIAVGWMLAIGKGLRALLGVFGLRPRHGPMPSPPAQAIEVEPCPEEEPEPEPPGEPAAPEPHESQRGDDGY